MARVARHGAETPRTARYGLLVGLVIAIVSILTTGSAYAYFNGGSGAGTGTATTGSLMFTVSVSARSAGALYPGGPAGSATVLVTNPSPTSTLTLTGVSGVVSTPPGQACDASNFDASGASLGATTVSAGNQSAVTVSGVIALKPSASSACNNTTNSATVALTITGKF